jgi:hypothetical protein
MQSESFALYLQEEKVQIKSASSIRRCPSLADLMRPSEKEAERLFEESGICVSLDSEGRVTDQ